MKFFSTAHLLLAAGCLLPACAFGQQNYQPAKVISLTGDTLRGFINYRGWDRNPRMVSFKADLQAAEQQFRPLGIRGFSVGGEQYAGARVTVENSPQELDKLSTTATPSYRADTVFLRALVVGPKSLYEYKAANGYNFFYMQQRDTYDLLVFKRYKSPGEGPTVMQTNNTFRDQLARYLADCPTIEPKLKALTYTASALRHAMEGYYTCTGQASTFQRRSKARHQFGVLAGITQTKLSFSDTKNAEYPAFDSYKQTGPSGGIFYAISLPGALGRFSVNNELVFTSFKASGVQEVSNSTATTYSRSENTLELAYVKLNSLLRFTKPIGAGSFFLNAGISNGYAVQMKSEKVLRERFYSTERTSTTPLFNSMRRYEQGLVGGIGASYKRLSAEGRFEYSNGFLSYSGFSSGFDRYSLLVGFRLF